MKGTNVVVTMQDGKRVNSTLDGITLTQNGYLVIKGFSAGYKVKMSAVKNIEISN